MTPKSLLRHPLAVSPVQALAGGRFERVVDDESADPEKVMRVVLCSGKVYYDLLAVAPR
jgi:2-oxoglutarate dehydrogenase E1 component